MTISAAVAKTARDALQAKWSAVCVGRYGVAASDAAQDAYARLLEDLAAHLGAARPQAPLVNAGYAARLAVGLHHLQGFLEFQRAFYGALEDVQIVVLGAGLDVTGLWALSQLNEDDHVHLVEVDTHSVWQTKRDALTELKWVEPSATQSPDDAEDASLWHGVPLVSQGQCRYSLVHADLRDTNKLQEVLHFLRPDAPTLVSCELVLAYLGDEPCDRLLEWCASHLCRHPLSCLFTFEPMGTLSPFPEPLLSVLGGYQRQYLAQFAAKLSRGHADAARGPGFAPLGADGAAVARRLRRAGWRGAHAVSAGEAAVAAVRFGHDLGGEEVFDEHAALALHLQSYVVAVGFREGSDSLLTRFLCAADVPQQPIAVVLKDGSQVWLTVIERQDEPELRHQFSSAYHKFFDTYPAIKKMVKTALRKDLALSVADGDERSQIHLHYRSLGGHFCVAVQHLPAGDADASAFARTMIGGIGWRRLSKKERDLKGYKTTTFEIHRLVVAPQSRRLGVARALLSRAEEIIESECPVYQVIASTPKFQADATGFYRGTGFRLMSERQTGDLTLQTFSKLVDTQETSNY